MTTDNSNEPKPVAFFDEEPEEGVVYIKPSIELKLTDKKRQECREIVREIKNFGVSQRQILFLIDLLALEVEDMNLVRAIRQQVTQSREKMNEKEENGLILPK